jgi:hypothetical protein
LTGKECAGGESTWWNRATTPCTMEASRKKESARYLRNKCIGSHVSDEVSGFEESELDVGIA